MIGFFDLYNLNVDFHKWMKGGKMNTYDEKTIDKLIDRIKELESELDSETKWAKEYHDRVEKLEDGIRKHQDYFQGKARHLLTPADDKLYKLLDK